MPFGYSYGLSIINSHIESGGIVVFNKKSVFEKDFWKIVKKCKITSCTNLVEKKKVFFYLF